MSDLDDVVSKLEDVESKLHDVEAAVKANKPDSWSLWWQVPFFLLGAAAVGWVGSLWYSNTRYAIQYQVGYSQITHYYKPTDCDFMRSPLGNKGCHYERQVSTVRVGTNQWGGQSISYDEGQTWIQTAKNKDGDPIVSTDGGKTWSTEGVPTGDIQATVTVDWVKMDDDQPREVK